MSTKTLSGSGRTLEIAADMNDSLETLLERHEFSVIGAGVIGGRPDDLAVDPLLDHVRRPSRRARDDEEWREHRGRYSHCVIADRRVPIEIGEHLLRFPHYIFQ